jgi:hypothetical protein
MAEHKAEMIEAVKVANGAVAFLARCCGDRSTDRRHTIYFNATITDAAIEQEIQDHLRATEALHAACDRVAAVLEKYKTSHGSHGLDG